MGRRREAYEEKQKAQLKILEARVDLLKARAIEAKADTKIEISKKVEQLRSKQREANEKLSALKNSGDEAWEEVKAGFEKAYNDLEDSVKRAISNSQYG